MTVAKTSVIDVAAIRRDFPILSRKVRGKPLVYLDNASTTHKPAAVIAALDSFYQQGNANIHRGAHTLDQDATRLYEAARCRVAEFIGAADVREIVFTRGTTESINLLAQTFGRLHLREGDEILLSQMEHHSNIVPWQLVARETGAVIRVIPLTANGDLDMAAYRKLLSQQTKLVAVCHASNALGTANPVAEIVEAAHAVGARVLIDGAQWVGHRPVDVQELDVDFYAFSGHKLFGPTGIGVLYGKRTLLEDLPPWQGGGDMIETVSFAGTTYAEVPARFEAGTPHIAGAIGLAAAIDYLQGLDWEAIAAHESNLLQRAAAGLQQIPEVKLTAQPTEQVGVLSFTVPDLPLGSLDIGVQLDLQGIAVRTGHHCCQPLMDYLSLTSTVRISVALYNTVAEIDALVAAVERIATAARKMAQKQTTAASPVAEADLVYPAATAPSLARAAARIETLFEFLPDWEARYQQIIEFGQKLPTMPVSLKTDENYVQGCQSTVHLAVRLQPGSTDRIEFLADSDADIVRGLAAILQRVYSGQTAAEIAAFDADAFLARLGLDRNLSLTRRNGLAAMIGRLRAAASAVAGPASA